MNTNTQRKKGPQLTETTQETVKRVRRRKSEDPIPDISQRIPGMALLTKSLKKTCENLHVREAQAAFTLALYAVELLHKRRDGFGMPVAKKAAVRPLTVREARMFTVVRGNAA